MLVFCCKNLEEFETNRCHYEFDDRFPRNILLRKFGAVTESVDVPRRLQPQPSGLLGHACRCAHRRRTHRCKTLGVSTLEYPLQGCFLIIGTFGIVRCVRVSTTV